MYGSCLSYIESEPFFSRDFFNRFEASSSDLPALPEKCVYLYDPLEIIVEHSFSPLAPDSKAWCNQLKFSLAQVNSLGCHAISAWRLALFYERRGHLNVLSDQLISDQLQEEFVLPKSGLFFAYLAQVLISDEPILLQHYLDLELSSLLLGTQIDSNWLKRIKSSEYKVYDFMHELHVMCGEKHHTSLKINSLSDELMHANEALMQMKSEINSFTASLEAAHQELDFYYNKNERKSKLLDDYSIALKKAMQIISNNH